MAFFVGQKVVYVGGKVAKIRPEDRFTTDNIKLSKGTVYTIREFHSFAGYTGIRLVEVVNEARLYLGGMMECAYLLDLFRPATDISDLIQIANEVKNGKPRKIEDDQFDRKKVQAINEASHLTQAQRDFLRRWSEARNQ